MRIVLKCEDLALSQAYFELLNEEFNFGKDLITHGPDEEFRYLFYQKDLLDPNYTLSASRTLLGPIDIVIYNSFQEFREALIKIL